MTWSRLQGAASRPGGGVLASRNVAALKWLTALAAMVLAWAGTSGQASAQSIESVMREMQARQKLADPAHPLKWPPCTCDDIEAPPYPPEGFYASQMADPRRAAELVGYVRTQFMVAAPWRTFVREEVGQGLEGKSVDWAVLAPDPEFPAQWEYGDGAAEGGIWESLGSAPGLPTVENYQMVLTQIRDAVMKLHYRELPVWPAISTKAASASNCEGPFNACDDWIDCVKAEIETARGWASGAAALPSMSMPATTLIGAEEALYLSMGTGTCAGNETCATCTSLVPGMGSAAFRANKGTFAYDLSDCKGSGTLYAMATGFNSGPGGNAPPCSTDQKFHGIATIQGEAPWQYSIGDDIQPTMTLDCSDWTTGLVVTNGTCGRNCFAGWAITETHVIFDHKFVTTPSVAAPCGGGGGEGCSSCGSGGDAAMPGQVTVAHDSMHVSISLGNSFTGKRAAALNIDVPDLLAADAYLAATAAGILVRESAVSSGVSVEWINQNFTALGPAQITLPDGLVTVNAQTVGGDPSLLLSFSRLQSVYKLIRLTYDRDDAQAPPAASFTIREMFGANESTTNFRETIFTQIGRRSDSSSCTSTMITGAGFEQHADQIHCSALDGTGERTETRTLRSNGGVPVRQTVTTYKRFSWGDEVISILEGTAGSDTRLQQFTYVTAGAAQGKLASETTSDGGQTTYTYNS